MSVAGCQIQRRESNQALRVGLQSGTASQRYDGKRPIEWASVSNLRATVPMVAGNYVALVGSYFEKMPSITEVVLNVYAEEAVSLKKVDVEQAAEALWGLCDQLIWPGPRQTFGDLLLGKEQFKTRAKLIVHLCFGLPTTAGGSWACSSPVRGQNPIPCLVLSKQRISSAWTQRFCTSSTTVLT